MLNIFSKIKNSVSSWRGDANDFWPFDDGAVNSCTFINHYSLRVGKQKGLLFSEFDFLFADGALLAKQVSLKCGSPIPRVSFDLSSVGMSWIKAAADRGYVVNFVGGSGSDSSRFLTWLRDKCEVNAKEIGFVLDGFGDLSPKNLIDRFDSSRQQFIVFGVGTPKQENLALEMARLLKERKICGVVATCGGFITQTAESISRSGDFYPQWVKVSGLRWLYRCVKQPYVIKRVLTVYPRSVIEVHREK